MRQVQPETPPKNSNFSSCLQNIKLKNNSGLGHVICLLIYFRFGSHIVEDFEVP
jgi:hypothetical protein